ncbi:hypothetical protein BVX93_00710, partial [bacterium B13(2017)]
MKNSKKLKALVIGGTGNLGQVVCKNLSENNFDIAFTFFKNEEKANEITENLSSDSNKVFPLFLDLKNIPEISQTILRASKELGGLDALIVTAGLATSHNKNNKAYIPNFFEISPEGYNEMMQTNVAGVFFACQQAALIMKENQNGKIVLVGSIDGVKPVPSPIDYATCKAALWGMTQSLSKELGKYNILIN